ncbi:MAG: hypothetical protein AAGD96_25600, partial [Chloroflexota bacterium]
MFDFQNNTPSGNLLRMLKFSAAIMVFSGVVRLIQLETFDLAFYVNTPNFMILLFGIMSYLAAYLIEQK